MLLIDTSNEKELQNVMWCVTPQKVIENKTGGGVSECSRLEEKKTLWYN